MSKKILKILFQGQSGIGKVLTVSTMRQNFKSYEFLQ